jgi:hypothetical protein
LRLTFLSFGNIVLRVLVCVHVQQQLEAGGVLPLGAGKRLRGVEILRHVGGHGASDNSIKSTAAILGIGGRQQALELVGTRLYGGGDDGNKLLQFNLVLQNNSIEKAKRPPVKRVR